MCPVKATWNRSGYPFKKPDNEISSYFVKTPIRLAVGARIRMRFMRFDRLFHLLVAKYNKCGMVFDF
ncbi:hypothetical protein EWB00_010771 [Schistosoma japonicum]|uniref:Uncharacterized protein n=1 Tax=Schistosoma japonicum TaxID=6182 RepID=A0A4Z2DPP6_SCHJA|nr:hypothetical protein EWB00_010771 [Schistosoma japonicum]